FNYELKKNISTILNETIYENEDAKNIITEYVNKHNLDNNDIFKECFMPMNSFPLLEKDIYLNGFLYKNDTHIIVYLPEYIEYVELIFNKHIDGIIEEIFNIAKDKIILNLFGLSKGDIYSVIDDMIVNNYNINFDIMSNNALDTTIIISNAGGVEHSIFQEYIAETTSRLKKYIYSTSPDSIYKVATNMLYLSKRHLHIVETFTKGYFTNNMFLMTEHKNIPIESSVYNNIFHLAKNLNIPREIYIDNKVNVKLISEITTQIYDNNKCDLLICLLGDYSNSDHYNTGYISITDEDGTHIYKNSVTGNEQDMIDVLSKSAAFYLIKKIKENNLLF
ncbi:MAG: hypothetical protein J6V40_03875, partial [Clostridia bacterium]|nr:hypothetical protein [Clostridia bacterium]